MGNCEISLILTSPGTRRKRDKNPVKVCIKSGGKLMSKKIGTKKCRKLCSSSFDHRGVFVPHQVEFILEHPKKWRFGFCFF